MDDRTALVEKAKTGDVGAQWDLNLQLDREAGTAPRPEGLAKLRLRRLECRLFPAVRRTMAEVEPALIAVFRALVAGEKPWPLLLTGELGVGKSRAALCLCDFADSAAFYSMENLLDLTMNGSADERAAEWERIRNKALVVVDEIGERETIGDLYHTTIKKVLDQREHHANRVAVYVTNLRRSDLPKLFDDRVVSRLRAGTVFELTGPDRRAEK